VLMASAVVVLKHEISILLQSHNFISIDLTFGVGDNVKKVTSPAKFGKFGDEQYVILKFGGVLPHKLP